MSGIPVDVAVEDELSELEVLRLLAVAKPIYHVGVTYRRGGFGYLRRTINGWNAAAKGKPFVVLTDLDDALCPAHLIREWLTSAPSPNLLFRVAVREVESWLLADTNNLAGFLRISERYVPETPDNIPDPKAVVIELARRSRISSRDFQDNRQSQQRERSVWTWLHRDSNICTTILVLTVSARVDESHPFRTI